MRRTLAAGPEGGLPINLGRFGGAGSPCTPGSAVRWRVLLLSMLRNSVNRTSVDGGRRVISPTPHRAESGTWGFRVDRQVQESAPLHSVGLDRAGLGAR